MSANESEKGALGWGCDGSTSLLHQSRGQTNDPAVAAALHACTRETFGKRRRKRDLIACTHPDFAALNDDKACRKYRVARAPTADVIVCHPRDGCWEMKKTGHGLLLWNVVGFPNLFLKPVCGIACVRAIELRILAVLHVPSALRAAESGGLERSAFATQKQGRANQARQRGTRNNCFVCKRSCNSA